MTFISELFGSTQRLYFQEEPLGTCLSQEWKISIKGSWPMRYLVSGDLIYGATGSKKGIAAWSFIDGSCIWSREDILFEVLPDYAVFANLMFCYHDSGEGRDPHWLDALGGDTIDPPFKSYGPPLGSIEGSMLLPTEQGLSVYDPS
ncbi:MAG: hypothetical protein GVY24_06120, partial [Planctomycetes bacterium]|nr:hypothetical protein [Planctomycetota bacterium]